MSQYGYIPIERVSDLKLTYSIANPKTWTFQIANQVYAGLEELAFSDAQKAEITSLGGQWFDGAGFRAFLAGPAKSVLKLTSAQITMLINFLTNAPDQVTAKQIKAFIQSQL